SGSGRTLVGNTTERSELQGCATFSGSLVFPNTEGAVLDSDKIRSAFKRALRAAGLPLHFTPHSLRHSYASILISEGVSPAYVQRQLGHTTYTLTVDTYGKWLPMGSKDVDRLDDP